MMLPVLMLLAADPETAIDAERAFSRAAQTQGQWTAFRRFMTDDATVFTPQPARAKEALPAKDPPIAVQWWPAESYVSCDGLAAVNTGPWVRPNASGYFTTVWERQPDGHFKWAVDGGDRLETPRPLPETPKIRRGDCTGKHKPFLVAVAYSDPKVQTGRGESPDHSLAWQWAVFPDGSRVFSAWLWTGRAYRQVIRNEIASTQ